MKILFLLFVAVLIASLNVVSAQEISQPFKISGDIQALGDVGGYVISDNNQWVVFKADAINDESGHLYSQRISGGNRIELTRQGLSNVGTALGINQFYITPDSLHVIFAADSLTDDKFELFIVPITGGTVTRLNSAAMPADADIFGASISYTSSTKKIVFADNERDSNNVRISANLYSVNIDGSNLTQINFPDTRASREYVYNFAISPDGQSVAFISASPTSFADVELFTVDIEGASQPIRLSNDIGVNNYGPADLYTLQYSPSGSHVLFAQNLNNSGQLHSVPALGGTPILLQNVDDSIQNRSIRVSADNQHVIYALGFVSPHEMYSVPLTGGVPIFLDTVDDDDGIDIVANGTQVVYSVDTPLQNINEFRIIPITGGTPRVLSNPGGSSRPAALLSPNNQFFVTSGRVNINGNNFNARFELRSVPFAGGTPTILSEDHGSPNITSDSKQIIYLRRTRNVNDDRISTLSIVDIAGGDEQDLSGPLPFMSSLSSYKITPNGQFAIFRADKDFFDKDELYAVELPMPEAVEETFYVIPLPDGRAAVISL